MKTLVLPNGQDIHIIDKLTALYVYNEIFVDKVYLKRGITVKEHDVVFDVGANIGLFTLFISNLVPNLQIFTFEPAPAIFQVLEANIASISARVKTYNIGLGEQNKIVDFFYYPKVSGDSTPVPFDWEYKVQKYLEHYEEAICQDVPSARFVPKFLRKRVVEAGLKRVYKPQKITCQIRSLSEIIAENRVEKIDMLKIDAENYEKQVIDGVKDEDWDKINQISMEVHTHIKGGENLMNEMIELLESKGFKTELGDESRETIMGVYMVYAKRNKTI